MDDKMTTTKKPSHFTEDNFNTNHVDSLEVIQQVKKHRVIYDMEHSKYHDQTYRSAVWEQIYMALYPLYRQYSPALQLKIGVLVRRRWKSVRNYIAQEAKLMVTTEYCRKRERQWSELQFILPYIKSPYCEKIAAEMGIKRLDADDANTHESNTNDAANRYHDESFIKREFIKEEEPFEYIDEDSINEGYDYISPLFVDDCVDKQSLSNTSTTTNPTPLAHPIFLHNKHDERISTPPMLTPKPSTTSDSFNSFPEQTTTQNTIRFWPSCDTSSTCNGATVATTATTPSHPCQLPSMGNVEPHRKRPCSDVASVEESSYGGTSMDDIQRKLLHLLINIEHRQVQAQAENDTNDLDRMFFLSLVPDFKLIPVHKKISVKAKIATIIAESLG